MFLSLCLMVIPIKGVFILFILMRSCSYNSCGHWNTEKHLRQTWQTKCRGGVPLIMPPWRIQTEIKAEQKQAWKYKATHVPNQYRWLSSNLRVLVIYPRYILP